MSLPGPVTVAAIQAKLSLNPSQPVCELAQLPKGVWGGDSCVASTDPGWCYVTGTAAAPCPQAVRFSPVATPHAGTTVVLGCP